LPDIFSLVLGEQWRIAGEYSQILLPMIAINFISTSFSGVIFITEKMKVDFIWVIYYVGVTVISLLLGCILFQNMKSTLIFFSIGRSSAYLAYIFLTYKFSKGNIVKAQMHIS
jgi:hypothetical protein